MIEPSLPLDDEYAASVIICTRNRSAGLKETLEALDQVEMAQPVELIVVDNGSSDATRSVVEAFRSEKYAIRYLYEGERGLANARNTGINAARGEILISVDDDVRPDRRWILEHLKAYDDLRVSAVQGKIELQFESPPPAWMEQTHRDFLAEKNPGSEPIFPYSQHLVGANMSFRRCVALEIGPFCPLLGVGRAGFWEESEFSERLLKKGYQQMFVPSASGKHVVPAGRLTHSYFINAAFRNGVSCYMAAQLGAINTQCPAYGNVVYANLRHIKVLFKARLRGDRYRCTQDDLFYRMYMGFVWGNMLGMKRLTKRYSR